jgi:hypothetical protein
LAQKYATRALEKPGPVALYTRARLVFYLQQDAEYLSGAIQGLDWSKRRQERAGHWFQVWQQLEKETNKRFDFYDLPRANVQPPRATGLPAGVAPEAINDAKLRQQYEAAIADNARKADRYRERRLLHDMEKRVAQKAEDYLVWAYSSPPFHNEELRAYLDEYVADKSLRERIMDQVIAKQKTCEQGNKPAEYSGQGSLGTSGLGIKPTELGMAPTSSAAESGESDLSSRAPLVAWIGGMTLVGAVLGGVVFRHCVRGNDKDHRYGL